MPYPSKQLEPEKGPAEWFGAELRFHRRRVRLSQNALGEKVFTSGDTIRRIETAERPCSLQLAQSLDQELETGGVLARAWPLVKTQADRRARDADKTEVRILEVDGHPDVEEMLDSQTSTASGALLDRRAFLASSASLMVGTALSTDLTMQVDRIAEACVRMGQQQTIGRADVTRLNAVHDLYQSLDYQYGGGSIVRNLSRIADASTALLDCDHHDRLRPELLESVAKLRLLAGWTAFDMCDHSSGQRHFAAAERLATGAEKPSLAVYVHYCQARQLQHLKHNRDAIQVLKFARQRLNAHSTPGTEAVVEATIAPSLAALGDRNGALAALDRANDAYEKSSASNEPSWIAWIDRAELDAQYGRVYRDLARHDPAYADQAVEWTQRAIGGFDEAMQRSSLLNQVGLCSATFLAGEPAAALEIGSRLLAEPDRVQSRRIRERITNISRDARGCAGRSDVDDFIDAVTSI